MQFLVFSLLQYKLDNNVSLQRKCKNKTFMIQFTYAYHRGNNCHFCNEEFKTLWRWFKDDLHTKYKDLVNPPKSFIRTFMYITIR